MDVIKCVCFVRKIQGLFVAEKSENDGFQVQKRYPFAVANELQVSSCYTPVNPTKTMENPSWKYISYWKKVDFQLYNHVHLLEGKPLGPL